MSTRLQTLAAVWQGFYATHISFVTCSVVSLNVVYKQQWCLPSRNAYNQISLLKITELKWTVSFKPCSNFQTKQVKNYVSFKPCSHF